jgi:threonyl-tRNA synthetase
VTDGNIENLRHSASHVLAQAVKELYPDVKLAIGPAIAEGFYYDFDFSAPISEKDLPAIEKLMLKKIAKGDKFEKIAMSKKEAARYLKEKGETYKLELLEDLPDGSITFYKHGDFMDLCAGPHVGNTKDIKAVKLLKLAGAYWRGSEKNKMLTRIYGTAFGSEKELKDYLTQIEEAEKRDHRKLGKELDLFSMHEEAPGAPFFHNNGAVLYNILVGFARQENIKRDYQEIMTPIILNESLWHLSGHWDHYKDNMYFTEIDEKGCAVKPMNCPGGLLVYKTKKYSYRDLPLKVGEFGRVHRHEKSGVLHGLFRVRTFVQDDAHIFCMEDQIQDEVLKVVDHVLYTYKIFGFKDFMIELSTKPDKAIGSPDIWEKAEAALKAALEKAGIKYKLNPGDGAFYGPKIDFHIKDSIGRSWQCGTIQLDFSMPQRFELTYTGRDGKEATPVMLHRAIFGSIERFMGILIENYAGKFPLWLAPVQVRLLTIGEGQIEFAKNIAEQMKTSGIRVYVDDRSEKIGYKIRDAQMQKIPYMAVIGKKEMEENSLGVRKRDQADTINLKVEEFIEQLLQEVKEYK